MTGDLIVGENSSTSLRNDSPWAAARFIIHANGR